MKIKVDLTIIYHFADHLGNLKKCADHSGESRKPLSKNQEPYEDKFDTIVSISKSAPITKVN